MEGGEGRNKKRKEGRDGEEGKKGEILGKKRASSGFLPPPDFSPALVDGGGWMLEKLSCKEGTGDKSNAEIFSGIVKHYDKQHKVGENIPHFC